MQSAYRYSLALGTIGYRGRRLIPLN
jgi:hypothetical protein